MKNNLCKTKNDDKESLELFNINNVLHGNGFEHLAIEMEEMNPLHNMENKIKRKYVDIVSRFIRYRYRAEPESKCKCFLIPLFIKENRHPMPTYNIINLKKIGKIIYMIM